MKKVVQWLFNSCGFHITRIRKSSEVTKTTARRTLSDALEYVAKLSLEIGFEPSTVIDVGVADGTPELYRSFPNSKFLLIEPIKEFKDSLEAICKQYDAKYVIAAATGQKGTTFINITPDLSGSTILAPKEPYLEFKAREVTTVTIDGLVDELGLKSPFIIKVDAQSSELHVLSGAIRTMERSEIIVLEVPMFQFVEGGPQFFDIVSFLKKNNFVVYDIVGNGYRSLDNALAEVDIVFVKENSIFRSSHLYASPEQRRRQFVNPDERFESI